MSLMVQPSLTLLLVKKKFQKQYQDCSLKWAVEEDHYGVYMVVTDLYRLDYSTVRRGP